MLLAAVAAAGCGNEADEQGPARTVESNRLLTVTGDEYSFDPENVVLEAGTGGQAVLRVRLVNAGSVAHNLRVLEGDQDRGGTATFQGGGEAREARVSLAPGEYRLVCTVGDHEALGMVGSLQVK